MKRIIVTGSTGFVGRHLVPKLLNEGFKVLEITRNKNRSSELFCKKTLKLGLDDLDFKRQIFDFKPNIIIHLASYLTSSDKWEDVEKLIDVNIRFLSKLLDTVSTLNLNLFINTGTFAEYSKGDGVLNPSYYYAATKTAARFILDYYSSTYNFKQSTIVPYTIYGGKDSQKKIIDIIYDSTKSREPVDLSPGEQILDFIHIEDVTDFYMQVVKKYDKLSNKTNFMLGTGIGHSLKKLTSKIESVTQLKTNINWGAKEYRKCDVMSAVANTEEMKNIFGWEPKITLEEGLQRVIGKTSREK